MQPTMNRPSDFPTNGKDFLTDLKTLLNYYGKDAECSTPDYALAMYLDGCLRAWVIGMRPREAFFGRDIKDGKASLPPLESPVLHFDHNVDGSCCSNKGSESLADPDTSWRPAVATADWESEGGATRA